MIFTNPIVNPPSEQQAHGIIPVRTRREGGQTIWDIDSAQVERQSAFLQNDMNPDQPWSMC